MIVNKAKIKIQDMELYIDVYKRLHYTSGIDYYTYYVDIYKQTLGIFRRTKYIKLGEYHTDWLDYMKYKGDIDKIIKEAIDSYTKNIAEQKYINEKEIEYANLK